MDNLTEKPIAVLRLLIKDHPSGLSPCNRESFYRLPSFEILSSGLKPLRYERRIQQANLHQNARLVPIYVLSSDLVPAQRDDYDEHDLHFAISRWDFG